MESVAEVEGRPPSALKAVLRRKMGERSKARPTSVHDAACSFRDVLARAHALWDIGSEVDVDLADLPASSYTDDTLRRPAAQAVDTSAGDGQGSAEGPVVVTKRSGSATRRAAAKKRLTKRATIVWSDEVEEVEKKRETRTWSTSMTDEVLHRIRKARLEAELIEGFIEQHGIFLMIVPAVGKFPALLHSIGLTNYGIPEVFTRCPQPLVKEAGAIINALAAEVVSGATTQLEDGSSRTLPRPSTHWQVRVLHDVDEIEDVNNGLLQVAATYYNRAVALAELSVQLPGSSPPASPPMPQPSALPAQAAVACTELHAEEIDHSSPPASPPMPQPSALPAQAAVVCTLGELHAEENDHFFDFVFAPAPQTTVSTTVSSTVSPSGNGTRMAKHRSAMCCLLCGVASNTRYCKRCSRVGRRDQFSSYRRVVKVCSENFTRSRRGSLDVAVSA